MAQDDCYATHSTHRASEQIPAAGNAGRSAGGGGSGERVSGPCPSLPNMSEETARVLSDANNAAEQARKEADREKQACLDVVAENLQSKVDAVAKRTAHAQPEVTKTLGKEGIQALRSALRDGADILAEEIRGAVDRIQWPTAEPYAPVQPGKIHSALFKFMYGTRVNRIAAVFKAHGYAIKDDNVDRRHGLLLPQELTTRRDLVVWLPH
jgi:hypothetical protein